MLYKLGAVPYLNALPLIHFLEEKPRLEPPAPLSHLLRIGEVDIATAPVVALFENPNYTLVPGVCIGSNGPVKSVKLFFTSPEVNVENVKSIYLDMESRTSVMLLKIILHFKYGRNLDDIQFFTPMPAHPVEAKLLIGDKSLKEIPDSPPLDLGYEWTSWTGLPFVYAAWISRHPEASERAIAELTKARDKGVKNISEVIPESSGFPKTVIEDYLKQLIYTLGPKEMEGMALFREYLLRARLMNEYKIHDAAQSRKS